MPSLFEFGSGGDLCVLRWDQINFAHGLLHVRRLKNGIDSVRPLGGTELGALRTVKHDEGGRWQGP